jgi:hypothetical protein
MAVLSVATLRYTLAGYIVVTGVSPFFENGSSENGNDQRHNG